MGMRILAPAIFGRLFGCVLVIALFSTNCFVSFAGLVISPTGGVEVFAGATAANFAAERDGVFQVLNNHNYVNGAAFTGKFYGSSISNLWIAENGNLNAAANGSFYSNPLSSNNTLRISPFGDDIYMLKVLDDKGLPLLNNQIINHSVAGDFMAITWKDVALEIDVGIHGPSTRAEFDAISRTAQVVWFERNMNVGGFSFRKNDIAFGYTGFSGGYIAATIGVGRNSSSFITIPGGEDGAGLIYSGDPDQPEKGNLIPWGDKEFLLFRPSTTPSGDPSYVASRENFTAVPEPSSIGVAIAWMCLVVAKWRRKIFSVVVGQRAC